MSDMPPAPDGDPELGDLVPADGTFAPAERPMPTLPEDVRN